jgi:hypothetical protein
MKIELTIKTTYLPEWGLWEGLRELAQNGRDAELEFDAPFTVRHRKDSNTLVFENEGCILPHEALLLGHTSKADRADLAGKFGEGMKLGILALVRMGLPVKIRSGSEVWVPSIQRSEKFDADVLVFDIQKGREPKNRVSVEIGDVTVESWEQFKYLFLFLAKLDEKTLVNTPNGSLILDEKYHGKVFVKGIFVGNDSKLHFGYDLSDAEIDRDRKMVAKYDLQYRTQCIWREALVRRPDLIGDFGKLLDRQAADIDGIDTWSAGNLPVEARKALAADFVERHGEGSLPVGSLSESQDVEHLGKKGIVCPKPLKSVLETVLGTVETNKIKLAEETLKLYGWHELDEIEKGNLTSAISLVNMIEPVKLDDVDVADFRDPKLMGLYKGGRVQIAKKHLSNRSKTLETLVHEIAHRVGGDGEKGHVANIERIWGGIVENLMGKAAN